MSDGKEVRRWSLRQLDHLSSNSWTNEDFVSSTDHDRIVAELNKILRQTIDLANSVANEREETIAAQAREIENLKKIISKEVSENDEFGSEFVMVNILQSELAKAKRVIEIAKRVLRNAGLRPPDGGTPTVETICEDLNDAIKELAAIERAEGEKEHE